MKALRLDDVPTPLKVAASLTAVEAVVLLGYAVAELAQISSGLAGVTLTTSAFFAVYGSALLVCAWGLVNRRSWARSPVVLAQLIQLGVAWSFRRASTTSPTSRPRTLSRQRGRSRPLDRAGPAQRGGAR